jgi:integrase
MTQACWLPHPEESQVVRVMFGCHRYPLVAVPLSLFPKTIVGIALMTGIRRGELFALRRKSFDEVSRSIVITEGVYEGEFSSPKTAAGNRRIPLSEFAAELLLSWKRKAQQTEEDSLIFGTRSGKPISPNNVLRRWVFPACNALKLQHATWLTFRRTYCSWAHDKGVPEKIVAELMGHANVSTTLNVYTQVVQESLKVAVNRIGEELFSIVQSGEGASGLIH